MAERDVETLGRWGVKRAQIRLRLCLNHQHPFWSSPTPNICETSRGETSSKVLLPLGSQTGQRGGVRQLCVPQADQVKHRFSKEHWFSHADSPRAAGLGHRGDTWHWRQGLAKGHQWQAGLTADWSRALWAQLWGATFGGLQNPVWRPALSIPHNCVSRRGWERGHDPHSTGLPRSPTQSRPSDVPQLALAGALPRPRAHPSTQRTISRRRWRSSGSGWRLRGTAARAGVGGEAPGSTAAGP